MRISVSDAKGQLTDLVRRAEAGDEVILTRHGHAAVRLVPVKPVADAKSRKALLDMVRAAAAGKATAGPNAARSQDFLRCGRVRAQAHQGAIETLYPLHGCLTRERLSSMLHEPHDDVGVFDHERRPPAIPF